MSRIDLIRILPFLPTPGCEAGGNEWYGRSPKVNRGVEDKNPGSSRRTVSTFSGSEHELRKQVQCPYALCGSVRRVGGMPTSGYPTEYLVVTRGFNEPLPPPVHRLFHRGQRGLRARGRRPGPGRPRPALPARPPGARRAGNQSASDAGAGRRCSAGSL